MTALFQFFAAAVVALATLAFSHFGVVAEGLELGAPEPKAERSVKRTPAISAPNLRAHAPR